MGSRQRSTEWYLVIVDSPSEEFRESERDMYKAFDVEQAQRLALARHPQATQVLSCSIATLEERVLWQKGLRLR